MVLARCSPALKIFAKIYPNKNPALCKEMIAKTNFILRILFDMPLLDADIVPHIKATSNTDRKGVNCDI